MTEPSTCPTCGARLQGGEIARSDDEKLCTCCERTLPRTTDYFYRVKAKRYAGGYRWRQYCIPCQLARNAADIKNAPEGSKLKETVRRVKRDWNHRHRPYRAAYAAEYRRRNPEKVAEIRKRYAQKNKAKIAAYHAAWYQKRKKAQRKRTRRKPTTE